MFSNLKPTTKSSWFIILPMLGVLAFGSLWSIYWFVAANKAEQILAKVLMREHQKGVTITCDNGIIQGFPFKFLLDCRRLKIIQETPTRLTTFTASRFVAAIMAYNYNHVITEFYGPYELTRSRKQNKSTTVIETRKLFTGKAGTIKASIILKNNALKQSTIIISELAGTLVDYTNKLAPADVKMKLEEAVIHIRATGSLSEPSGPYEAGSYLKNLSLVGGVANIQSPAGTKLDDFVLRANITEVPYTLRGKPLNLLKIWKTNKGKIDITELAAGSGPLKLIGTGTGTLNTTSYPEGVVNMQITGLDTLVKTLVAAGKVREQEATLGLAAIKLLGTTNNGGVKIALRATKGNLYFGPFLVAKLKPVLLP